MLLMMVGFFTPLAGMVQPERVARVHDFYTHKLQVRLRLQSAREGEREELFIAASISETDM